MQKLRKFLATLKAQQREVIARTRCQCCTIDTANTLDHYVPEGTFLEYSVLPLNLIPMCGYCNSKKSNVWLVDGKRQFLNLYLDSLPTEKYLVAKIVFDTYGTTSVSYELLGNLFTSPKKGELIKTHFGRLDLLDRFASDALAELVNIKNDLSLLLRKSLLTFEQVVSLLAEQMITDRKHYGENHYKSSLKQTLVDNPELLRKLIFDSD